MGLKRRLGRIAGWSVAFVFIVVLALYSYSSLVINKVYAVEPVSLEIPRDSATVARGQHVAVAIAKCVDCHGANLAGKGFIQDGALGHMYGANLTSGMGGVGSTYSDADFARAIRYGVKKNGKSVAFMPVRDYSALSDQDLSALIAYIRTIPPVDTTMPGSSFGPLGRALLVSGKVKEMIPSRFVSLEPNRVPEVPAGVTVAYGSYLATTGGCLACHGPSLAGGPVPGGPPSWPAAANLTPAGIGAWVEEDFFRALREGTRPDKTVISSVMPWNYTRLMTDDEIRALWMYIKTFPAVPTKS